MVLNNRQLSNLASKKIFFGHQSVGDNIVQGIKDVMATQNHLKLNVVSSSEPAVVPGYAFVETHIGKNRDPQSKNEAFAAIVNNGLGKQGGIVLYKYCYIDFGPSTDVGRVFDSYRKNIAELKQKYPSLTFVHVTVPLTTEPSPRSATAWLKTTIRRVLGRDENVKRNEFNDLLRQEYMGQEPIFDLAEIESTHSDGSRCYFLRGLKKIYSLAPELTNDGGHLNETGRRVAAEGLLTLLASL